MAFEIAVTSYPPERRAGASSIEVPHGLLVAEAGRIGNVLAMLKRVLPLVGTLYIGAALIGTSRSGAVRSRATVRRTAGARDPESACSDGYSH